MLPTFDWSNLVKGILRRGVFSTFNPVVLFLALATGVAALGVTAYTIVSQVFGLLPTMPQLDLGMIYSETDQSGLLNLFLYISCLDKYILLVNIIINLVGVIIVFVPTFLVSLLGLVLTFRFSHNIRQTILDYFG